MTHVNVLSANSLPSGYGHRKITVELEHNGKVCEFSAITSDMPSYDAAMDFEDYAEKVNALYEIIKSKIHDAVHEWIEQF
jgi:hypothetical protein